LANTSNAIAIVYKNLGLYDLAIQYSLIAEKAFNNEFGRITEVLPVFTKTWGIFTG
jgi:hypothetical protein